MIGKIQVTAKQWLANYLDQRFKMQMYIKARKVTLKNKVCLVSNNSKWAGTMASWSRNSQLVSTGNKRLELPDILIFLKEDKLGFR